MPKLKTSNVDWVFLKVLVYPSILKQNKLKIRTLNESDCNKLDVLVFEEEPLDEPESTQDQPVDLGDGEGPGHSVHVVEELVGQWRAHRLVRHPLVDDGDDHSGEDEVERGVEEGHGRLPPLLGEAVGPFLRHRDLDVLAVFPQTAAQSLDQLVLFQQAAQFAARPAIVCVRGGRRRGGELGDFTVGDPRRASR